MLKDLKNLFNTNGFVVGFVITVFLLLVYLLVKSPKIKTTTDIQLDGTEFLDSTAIADSLAADTIPFRIQE
jgi:hypothetical protein